MKAKVTVIKNGVTRHLRDIVDPETWLPRKIDFLTTIYKFDDCQVSTDDNREVFTLRCHRDAKKVRTNGKAIDLVFVLEVIEK